MDTGELETEVDGTLYHLKEKDLMIYGPGQFHTQYTDEEHRASYMTILFDMRNLTPVERVLVVDRLVVDRAVVQKTVVGSFALHSNPSLLKKYIIFLAF